MTSEKRNAIKRITDDWFDEEIVEVINRISELANYMQNFRVPWKQEQDEDAKYIQIDAMLQTAILKTANIGTILERIKYVMEMFRGELKEVKE